MSINKKILLGFGLAVVFLIHMSKQTNKKKKKKKKQYFNKSNILFHFIWLFDLFILTAYQPT